MVDKVYEKREPRSRFFAAIGAFIGIWLISKIFTSKDLSVPAFVSISIAALVFLLISYGSLVYRRYLALDMEKQSLYDVTKLFPYSKEAVYGFNEVECVYLEYGLLNREKGSGGSQPEFTRVRGYRIFINFNDHTYELPYFNEDKEASIEVARTLANEITCELEEHIRDPKDQVEQIIKDYNL